jgi:hypothetical protein
VKEYYNTNRESGSVLAQSQAHARDQKMHILQFFERNPGTLFAPHEVQAAVLPEAPLTSIRRALTNLTDQGLLEKTDKMRLGTYGKMVHRWRLRPEKPRVEEVKRIDDTPGTLF